MDTIDLAYVGRGLHEELAAYIADQEDYYADEGVHVALRDGCDWDEQRLRRGATIGLGRALLSRLTNGVPWVALTVNTDRPLFWFLARSGLTSLADLAGQRLAVHAPHTAPGCFARIVLRQAGLDPDRDVRCVARPPGDYGLDLRHLPTARSTRLSSAAPWHRRRSPRSTAGRCWPGSATTSGFPPSALPSIPPTSSRTTRRSGRSCGPSGVPCG